MPLSSAMDNSQRRKSKKDYSAYSGEAAEPFGFYSGADLVSSTTVRWKSPLADSKGHEQLASCGAGETPRMPERIATQASSTIETRCLKHLRSALFGCGTGLLQEVSLQAHGLQFSRRRREEGPRAGN